MTKGFASQQQVLKTIKQNKHTAIQIWKHLHKKDNQITLGSIKKKIYFLRLSGHIQPTNNTGGRGKQANYQTTKDVEG